MAKSNVPKGLVYRHTSFKSNRSHYVFRKRINLQSFRIRVFKIQMHAFTIWRILYGNHQTTPLGMTFISQSDYLLLLIVRMSAIQLVFLRFLSSDLAVTFYVIFKRFQTKSRFITINLNRAAFELKIFTSGELFWVCWKIIIGRSSGKTVEILLNAVVIQYRQFYLKERFGYFQLQGSSK